MLAWRKRYLVLVIHSLLLFPALALADSGQGDFSALSTVPAPPSSGSALYEIGSTFSGTLSDIQFNVKGNAGSTGDWSIVTANLTGYTDSTYATPTGDTCGQTLNESASDTFDGPLRASAGSSNRGPGFTTPTASGPNGCNIMPGEYYTIQFSQGPQTLGAHIQLRGSGVLPTGVIQINNDFDIAMPFFALLGVNGGFQNVESNDTHIVTFTPEEASTTGNLVTFTIHVHINPADLGTFLGVQLTYKNIDQNYLLSNIPGVTADQTLFFGQATTSGEFFYTATSSLPDGNYRVNAVIQRTLVGTFVNPLSSINDNQSHQFIVNQETYIGHLNQNGFREFQQLLGSTTATSSAASSATCNPLGWVGASSTLGACLGYLFIPGGPELDQTVSSFQSGVVSRAPWGYFYRLYQIFTGSATSSLPGYTVSMQVGPPDNLATTSLTYDPQDMIAGAGDIVNGLTDPQNGMTLRQIMEPFVLFVIGIAVMLQILSDLLGSHRHHTTEKHKR